MTDWNKAFENVQPQKVDQSFETWVRGKGERANCMRYMDQIKANLLSITAIRSKLTFSFGFSYWGSVGTAILTAGYPGGSVDIYYNDEHGLFSREKVNGWRGTFSYEEVPLHGPDGATKWALSMIAYKI